MKALTTPPVLTSCNSATMISPPWKFGDQDFLPTGVGQARERFDFLNFLRMEPHFLTYEEDRRARQLLRSDVPYPFIDAC